MDSPTFSSPAIARKVARAYGTETRKVRIQLLHEQEVREYLKRIKAAHKKAAKSKLTFP